LLKNLAPGEIFWANRGKQMIIAVGHVSIPHSSRCVDLPSLHDCTVFDGSMR
jgi:hypothetical protein